MAKTKGDEVVDIVGLPKQENTVPFTAEQMAIVEKMIQQSKVRGNTDSSISVYGMRDPKKIETVKVSQFDGMFVIGFKDLQNNPLKKTPKYSETKMDIIRKLPNEPFITLLLSNDGEKVVEKEVPLVDFMNYRERIVCPVIKLDKEEVIKDHGILGRQNDQFGAEIDENNRPVQSAGIKAEYKTNLMKYYVELPGFNKPVEFIEDFLA